MTKNKIILPVIVFVLIILTLSLSSANQFVEREFERELLLGELTTVTIRVNAETRMDIAEYLHKDLVLLDWSMTSNVQKTVKDFGNHKVIHFQIEEGQTEINYSFLPRYAREYEINSIITTPDGFEKETFNFIVSRTYSLYGPLKWLFYLTILSIFLKVVEEG